MHRVHRLAYSFLNNRNYFIFLFFSSFIPYPLYLHHTASLSFFSLKHSVINPMATPTNDKNNTATYPPPLSGGASHLYPFYQQPAAILTYPLHCCHNQLLHPQTMFTRVSSQLSYTHLIQFK
jgi:hypothetical protein